MDDYKENNEKCQNFMGIYDKTLFEPNEKLVEDEEDLKDLISSIQTTVEKMYYNEDFDLILQFIKFCWESFKCILFFIFVFLSCIILESLSKL